MAVAHSARSPFGSASSSLRPSAAAGFVDTPRAVSDPARPPPLNPLVPRLHERARCGRAEDLLPAAPAVTPAPPPPLVFFGDLFPFFLPVAFAVARPPPRTVT